MMLYVLDACALIAALYGEKGANVTITAEAKDNGRIFTNGSGFILGEAVILTAIPNDGYRFSGWYENGERLEHAENVYEFSATSSRTLEARFLNEYDFLLNEFSRLIESAEELLITTHKSENGIGIPSNEQWATATAHEDLQRAITAARQKIALFNLPN